MQEVTMSPIVGWGALNIIISPYKKFAVTTLPQVYSVIVLEDNRHNAAGLCRHKGYKPVSVVEKLAFLTVYVETSIFLNTLMHLFIIVCFNSVLTLILGNGDDMGWNDWLFLTVQKPKTLHYYHKWQRNTATTLDAVMIIHSTKPHFVNTASPRHNVYVRACCSFALQHRRAHMRCENDRKL